MLTFSGIIALEYSVMLQLIGPKKFHFDQKSAINNE